MQDSVQELELVFVCVTKVMRGRDITHDRLEMEKSNRRPYQRRGGAYVKHSNGQEVSEVE